MIEQAMAEVNPQPARSRRPRTSERPLPLRRCRCRCRVAMLPHWERRVSVSGRQESASCILLCVSLLLATSQSTQTTVETFELPGKAKGCRCARETQWCVRARVCE